MKRYVQVTINLPEIEGVFDYQVPDDLSELIEIGMLISVPFGKQKVQGVVIGFVEFPQVPETKEILEILYEKPIATKFHLDLVKWMARETLSSESSCFQLILPGGLGQIAESLFTLGVTTQDFPLSPVQRKIVNLLSEKGPLRGRQLDTYFRRIKWKDSIKKLIQKKIVISEPYLSKPKIKPKFVTVVQLACDREKLPELYPGQGKISPAVERRKAILDLLALEKGNILLPIVYGKTGANKNDIDKLVESGLITLLEIETIRDPLESMSVFSIPIPELSDDQLQAWNEISTVVQKDQHSNPIVLHGVTGSGKTEIYLRAVDAVIKKGKQAIILVPEISLTPQTVQRFLTRFPKKVGIFHSKLSEGERFDTWRRVLSGELSVVVGPRSALFVPFENPGIIILDEAHDESYYQDDQTPRYSSLMVAKEYGKIANAVVIFGSATPGIEMMYRAKLENWKIVQLPSRIIAHKNEIKTNINKGQALNNEIIYQKLPDVQIIDMRNELKSGNSSIFSRDLHTSIEKTLESGHQVILFLNRRGSSTYVFCRSCGYRVLCPRCDLSLTYHAELNLCICHHCNYQRQIPMKCPECGSPQIRQLGVGTEKVESEVKKQFPSANVIRMDSGATRTKGAHLTLLNQFASRQADVLVGTQMLAKGIDFPYVTLVGVVLADIGLGLPDFRSSERTFQLLTQVAGRAGRSPLGGNVIFQTYQPENYAIQKASKHDYEGFFHQEIEKRRKLNYPPFTRLVRLESRSQKETEAKEQSEIIFEKIKSWIESGPYPQTELIGPVPCYFQRLGGYFRWQVIIRGPRPTDIIRSKDLGEAIITIDPVSLL